MVLKKLLFAGLCLVMLTFTVNAQTKTGADYYEGKWKVLLKGLPNGDTKMVFLLEKKDTALGGSVQDTTGVEISKLTNVELSGDEATLYFNAQGYDVTLSLKKKDDTHVSGSLMGMFEAEGEKLKAKH